MKSVNAYYRKTKTLDGCPDLSEELKTSIQKSMSSSWRASPVPFESYSLQNNLQNIKSTQSRLDSLLKIKQACNCNIPENSNSKYENPFFKVVENAEAMRIQLIFEGKPDEQTRAILKSHAFKWSPSFGAWQRQLNSNGRYAVNEVIKKLQELAA